MKPLGIVQVVFLASCTMLPGCSGDNAPIWSVTAASPNGQIIAQAQTNETGGFGTADMWTNVALKQPKTSHALVILSFDDNDVPSLPIGDTAVGLHWLSNTDLCVTYGANARVLFQAVTAWGVTISIRQSASGKLASSCVDHA